MGLSVVGPRTELALKVLAPTIALLVLSGGLAAVHHYRTASNGANDPTYSGALSASATSSTTAPTVTTTTAPPRPPRLLVTVTPGPMMTDITAIDPTRGGTETGRGPGLPRNQVSEAAGVQIYSKTLLSSPHPYSGCGFAGCTMGYASSTESGIALSDIGGGNERLLTHG